MSIDTTGRIAVKPSQRNFMKGVGNAKKMGGQFDGDGKVWWIPAARPELRALGAYSLTFAGPACVACGSHACIDGECGFGVAGR